MKPNYHHVTSCLLAVTFCFAGCMKKELPRESAATLSPVSVAAGINALAPLNEIKVMSFNIRKTDPADAFSQEERKSYILQVILNNDVDIFGIQELADNAMETYFNTQMAAAGYGVYNAGLANGSPKSIWYKNSRFTRTNAGWFTMHTPDYRSGKWVILQDKLNTSNSYFVVNSHWTTVSSAERTMNADSVLLAINTNNTQDLPVICMGDFNGQPGTTEINRIKNSSGLNMVDALFEGDGGLTFHGWDATGNSKLDYIMSTRDLGFTSSSVITTSFTVGGQTLWPSDHWPVVASYVPAVFGGAHADVNGKSASSSTFFYFADVNGDGKKDKIYWNRTYDSGRPQVFLSNGNGTFQSPAVVHTAGASTLATTKYHYADVNGDGKADQILWDPTLNSGHTRVYLATTNGNFSATVVDNPEGTSAGATTVYHFADVNGDGKADKIYWNSTFDAGHTRVYLATSGGSFGGVVSGAEGASTTAGTLFYYADVNGDGKADKILWHPTLNSGKTMVYLSDGDGNFTASSTFSNSGATSGVASTVFYFSDVNGDGRADKIYWNPGNYLGEPKVYYSETTNAFVGPIYSLRGTSQSADTKFYFSDISGDGKADQVRWNFGEYTGELRNYFAN
ncbi:endonuclease [Chitinophaga sp. SYP-B3965]|uniref:FG-GAP-like repeat-containing protein n=1 Tax=Chitinophaga sp. SYP-B3965 TaxID=2663120 RepID=UPI001299CD7A|nr:FG-GAP-like repeat-containing protein [Chitinophaga sp. SYP-B3965]MRG43919.1 endonuclease [Chitinophaga sp. SYP-B3965]